MGWGGSELEFLFLFWPIGVMGGAIALGNNKSWVSGFIISNSNNEFGVSGFIISNGNNEFGVS